MTRLTSSPTDVSNAYWGKTRVTTPDADSVLETATSGSHNLAKEGAINLVSSRVYILDIVTKSVGGRSYSPGVFNDDFSSGYVVNFDLVNGVVGSVTFNAGVVVGSPVNTITPVGNGYYRCRLRFTAGANVTGANFYWGIEPTASSSGAYAGDITKGIDVATLGLYLVN